MTTYETLNEEPLYLTGQDAAFVRNLLKNPSGFLDEYMESGRILMARPKASAQFAMIQPTTFAGADAYGTLNRDWVDRMQAYAEAKARGDRAGAFAAISAEVKAAGGNGNTIPVPLQLSAHDIGALAIGVANTRREAYKDLAIAAGAPVVNADGSPRDARDIARDFRVTVGAPVPYIKAISAGPGAPITFLPAQEICTEEHLRNAKSITAQHNAETNQTEFHIPVAAGMKIIGQSILRKEKAVEMYHAPVEAPIVPVGAPAVKALESHLNEVAKTGVVSAFDTAKIGEHLCNNATKCVGEAHFDNLFVGEKRQEIGTSLNDVISAVYNVFPVGTQSPFSEKSEVKLREAIGAAQGAVVSTKKANGGPQGVSYDLFVGANFLPAVGYHLENPTNNIKSKKGGVFEHEAIGEHYEQMGGDHAVISAKMADGTCIDTMILPVAGGVKIIGDHVHGGYKDGKHRKRRGHTAYDSDKRNVMGMLY